MEFISVIRKTFSFNIGNLKVSPEYWQAGIILFLMFLLIFSLARLRHMYVHWSLKGFVPTVIMGFVLAIAVEGLLLVGGRTLFIEILGWENAPKPISTALDEGRGRLIKVLGVEEANETEEDPTLQNVYKGYLNLGDEDADKVQNLICEP